MSQYLCAREEEARITMAVANPLSVCPAAYIQAIGKSIHIKIYIMYVFYVLVCSDNPGKMKSRDIYDSGAMKLHCKGGCIRYLHHVQFYGLNILLYLILVFINFCILAKWTKIQKQLHN